jgi:ATP-binding cassette subfamily B protein/subfamily B ATP-binding cassette protein MsbA
MFLRYRRLIAYPAREWRVFAVVLAMTAAGSVAGMAQPWPMKILVDHALGSAPAPAWLADLAASLGASPTPSALVVLAAAAGFGLFVVNSALEVALGLAWTLAGQRMIHALAGDLFNRLQRLSLLYHARRSVGDLLSRLTGDTWCVNTVTNSLLVAPVQACLTLVAVCAVAWKLDSSLTLLSLAVAPVMGASAFYFGRGAKQRARGNREAQSRTLTFVHRCLGAIAVVKAFGAERRNVREYTRLAEEVSAHWQRNALHRNAYTFANGLASTAGTALVLYVGAGRVLSGTLTVGGLLVFLAYLRTMQGSAKNLLNAYVSLKTAEASADRIFEVLDAEEEVREELGAEPVRAGPRGRSGHVVFEGVTFGYEAGRAVLEGVDLEARPGQVVALVGPTGAGKTTLASLVPRFYDPWEGRVTLDGRDLRRLELEGLRRQVSLVLQEPLLLPLSIAENIAYARPGAPREQVEAAARAANADAFIRRLPRGYDTVVGERGATLSGGERQRVAIARALLKDAPVLVLDEPTSALDAETEARLLEALERLMAGRTTFIIAHRLSTIRRADRIVVLDSGRVVESGSHAQLLAARGMYRRFHDIQFPAKAEEVAR